MKLSKKLMAGFTALLLSSSVFALDWSGITTDELYNEYTGKINSGLNDFAEQLAIAVPQAATQQNVWADAYIGKLFPSFPCHLGGGFNVGLTHIDTSGLAKAASVLNIDGIEDSYFLPVFTADIRLGGILLPFDFGLTVMKTGTISTDKIGGCDLGVDFLTIGADFRYAVIDGGLVMPKLSVGAGYFYNQGKFTADSSYANTSIEYKVQTLYASVQLSKKFLFITPFVGLRGLVSNCENSWDWEITNDTAVDALEYLSKSNNAEGKVETDSFDFNAIQPQFYFGCGVNFFVVQATASITCDLRHISDSGLWSGALSLRLVM
ncbi:MAG: hypothetical protein IJ312_08270 [Treponema sp.]|nr:hypothetical protein [Treponema sp.]